MARRIMGPFARVEGHLEIELQRSESRVLDAKINAPLYRGMETVMLGHDPMDALTIAPRICGICSVAQSVASSKSLRNLNGSTLLPNAQLMENLVLGCEMLSNHLTHFYLFFMPDFAHPIYENEIWFEDAQKFKSETGPAQNAAIDARTHLLEMMGILAGKWPHTLCIRPGGSTISLKQGDLQKLKITLNRFQKFLESRVFARPLDFILDMKSHNDLNELGGDFGFFCKIANSLGLDKSGAIEFSTLSCSSFEGGDTALFQNGLSGQSQPEWSNAAIEEDLSHSFMSGQKQTPTDRQTTEFNLDKENAYTWCKAPRLKKESCEVGAYARHHNLKTNLIFDQAQRFGSSVSSRITARVWEMAFLCQQMKRWIDEIDPSGEFYDEIELPTDGKGFGAVEAARGSLMHWLEVENAKIVNYQIIAPTTWNFSPRDELGQKGPLEMALEGTLIKPGEEDPTSVRHIVRSFDPCMACTVH